MGFILHADYSQFQATFFIVVLFEKHHAIMMTFVTTIYNILSGY